MVEKVSIKLTLPDEAIEVLEFLEKRGINWWSGTKASKLIPYLPCYLIIHEENGRKYLTWDKYPRGYVISKSELWKRF